MVEVKWGIYCATEIKTTLGIVQIEFGWWVL